MPNLAICLTLVRFALFGSRDPPTIGAAEACCYHDCDRMADFRALRKLISFFPIASIFCIRTDFELLKRMSYSPSPTRSEGGTLSEPRHPSFFLYLRP